ncbi:U-box domain-containing protein 45-like [Asparagus officinalis]|uniref:U-box domain-containing protein 45-like n=1 Tax=Asparagus officinalis TaxID=4686 RepID=UPI00098E61AC|nr:U-box domain-containing protein 45-like [Asparagus officinalis]
MSKLDSMDVAEIEESLFAACDAKLHGGMCKQLSIIVCRILEIFPVLEAGRPRSKSGIQALCSLHVALDKAKNLLQHCSECSKLYLAITGESILLKFEKVRCALQDSLKRVEEIVPQAVGRQIMEIARKLEEIVFALDQSEKQVGDDVIVLLQKERKFNSNLNDVNELEIFHQAALKLGITSSRAALTERRALKKLIERARIEEDKRKESIVAFLHHLMRKYSKLFRSDLGDDTDSQGSGPCSPTFSSEANGRVFERQFSRLSSFNFKQNGLKSGNMSLPPEEFRCPISLQLMYDPVIISSGQTYERVCIEKWFNDGHNTCPKTQQELSHLALTPNYCVKGLIASWCEQNGISIPDGPPESLDLNYWRLALSEREASNSRSMTSVNSCQLKEVKVVPLEESVTLEEPEGGEMATIDDTSWKDAEVDQYERYESLLAVLCDGQNWKKKCKAVEEIRFLLKDDDEARIYMGANGFVDALLQFLASAVNEEDEGAQETGAMALFNLAVNNNRNKAMLLSSGVIPLLETMITNSKTCESSAALYLNLSCLDEAKPIIGSSKAVPFLIHLLHPNSPQSLCCKHDALYALFNLSTHPSNIPFLLSADIIDNLNSLLSQCTWPEKVLAVFINLLSDPDAKEKMVSAPGFIGSLALVLDSGEPPEQEQAVSCLLVLCITDDNCSQLVLQEGVIPALVSLTVNGTTRGKEKAQKLLKLFREQRQKEQPQVIQLETAEREESEETVMESKPGVYRSRTRRLGKTISSLFKSSKSFLVN